jgi:hypothetical protein
MKITEAVVHCAVRGFLKKTGWRLVAGQFPGGSDDECHILNVMDPLLCGDACPDPSRHSENKLVPDLFAWKPGYLLVIEMKPSFSVQDEQKLIDLLTTRRNHLHLALRTFAKDRSMPIVANPELLEIVPCLAFKKGARFNIRNDFCYFLIESLDSVSTHRSVECVVPDELLIQPKDNVGN